MKLRRTLRYRMFTSQKFKYTTCEGSKRMAPVITKSENMAQKLKGTTTSPHGVERGKEMCNDDCIDELKPLKLLFSCLFSMASFVGGQVRP